MLLLCEVMSHALFDVCCWMKVDPLEGVLMDGPGRVFKIRVAAEKHYLEK